MESKYIPPIDVISPKQNWTLIDVIDEGTEGQSALAVGKWKDKKRSRFVLAMRWNGENNNESKRMGNPQSTAHPTWFIIPEKYNEGILQNKDLDPDKVALARRLLNVL